MQFTATFRYPHGSQKTYSSLPEKSELDSELYSIDLDCNGESVEITSHGVYLMDGHYLSAENLRLIAEIQSKYF